MNKYTQDYLRLLRFARPYFGVLMLAALCMGVSTIFEGVTLGSIGPLTDRLLTKKEIILPGEFPEFVSSFIAYLNSIEPGVFLKVIVIFLPALFLAKGFFLFLQDYLMNVVGQGVVKNVRNQLYGKFHQLSMNFYARARTGELLSRVTNDVTIITNAISYALKDLIFESMKALFFISISLWLGFNISWKLPIVVFIIFPAVMYPVIRIGRHIKRFTGEVQKRMADLNSHMAETILGAQVVKAFCREDFEKKRFSNINQQYYKFSLKNAKRIAVIPPLTEFTGALAAVAMVWIIFPELNAGRISFGSFAMFLYAVFNLIRPLKKLSGVHAINQKALSASERIYEIIDEEPQIQDKPGARDIDDFRQTIRFDNVWFRYSPQEEYVLQDIDIEVRKGQTIALVGYSGVGKTTLVSLLPRFYDIQRGRILIDEIDVRDCTMNSLRSLMAIVSQETILFNAPVRENIAYGKESAPESEIIEAAKKAHAYEFISGLPEAFDTVVGDRGFRLSGGEKQRIAIARAFLKNAPILILDEATSSLDTVSEQLIQKALYALMEGKTTFVIAHRLSTVQKADRIIVLEKGRIIETGSHEHLLASGRVYKKLYDLQFNV
jgi:subfamily B ATP-binding cassette protein MsbA